MTDTIDNDPTTTPTPICGKIMTIGLALAAASLGGCASLPTRTGVAAVAVQTEAGTVTEVGEADKSGEACSQNVLGIVTFGDSSIARAKAIGGITRVASVDYEYLKVLVFYGRVCTIVRGV